MSIPDPMASIFTDYTADISAEVQGSGTGPLRRKARRRRIGRTAAAGTAALALIAPATWLLADVAGAGERSPQPYAGATGDATVSEEPDASPEEPEPSIEFLFEEDPVDAGDLMGATVDMPSFVPGNGEVEAVCGSGDTVVVDGMYHGAGESGEVEEGEAFVLVTTQAVVTAEDRIDIADGTAAYADLSLVGYFGCDYGREFVFQVVVLEATGDGTWKAEQLVHSQPGGEVIKGAITGDDGELLVGFAERWDPGAGPEDTDTEHWIEHVRLDDEGAAVREPSEYGYWSLVIDSSPLFPAE
ncbi:hypothetical protein [Glycomyces sp. YM15]|uniref:hypothetical protein n=1 Tax=Glycomyces sp. YM15 TaxID=2800446 RepID=UPI0019635697|nr:hypothetical protein [Glycomyces sp. YM15]